MASPCVGSGSNSAQNLPALDLDGNPRITGDKVDMGAFESIELPVRNINTGIFYESIQAAIDDATEGDQILAMPKTYYETINFNGKAVRLYSSGGPEVTTINGIGHYHVVQCVNGEDPSTVLEGFTITGGNANGGSNPDNCGGGMLDINSSPTVKGCYFTANSVTGDGGGMYNLNSNPTVTNCSFAGNTATYAGGGDVQRRQQPDLDQLHLLERQSQRDKQR